MTTSLYFVKASAQRVNGMSSTGTSNDAALEVASGDVLLSSLNMVMRCASTTTIIIIATPIIIITTSTPITTTFLA